MNTNNENILNNLPELDPPDRVWQNIEIELDRKAGRRILPYWVYSACIAAACVGLIVFSYVNFNDKVNETGGIVNLSADKIHEKPETAVTGLIKDSSNRTDSFLKIGTVWLDNTTFKYDMADPAGSNKWWGFSSGSDNTGYDREGFTRNYLESDNVGYKDGIVLNLGNLTNGIYYMRDQGEGYRGKSDQMLKKVELGNVSLPINPEIVIAGEVDTRAIGTYTLTYYVQDIAGNTSYADGDAVPNMMDREDIAALTSKIEGPPWQTDSLRYQCIIRDTVKFLNSTNFYHNDKDFIDDDELVLGGETYAPLIENEYKNPFLDPFSTFSIDVDNASYSNTRRMLMAGNLPAKDAVRIEEFINYFDYEYPQPADQKPFSVHMETASCPWNKETRLVHIGIQGMDVNKEQLPPSNLVFLVDVSGSMDNENKLPLVKKSLKLLVDQMRPVDRIALVTYAGAAGLALNSTPCSEKELIKAAIDNLDAGGSTAGGQGLQLAYKTARENFISTGNNRIVLVTDGDFNVGLQSDEDMKNLVEQRRKDGVFLTVCGFGMDNLKDSKMETIADYGNGNYYYIDNFKESRKVFGSGLTGTLMTIAKDVKIQVEFNPALVRAYRLVGYENRLMEATDFSNDAKDAGELGAGHTVTAIYEIIPAGSKVEIPGFTELKYQQFDTKPGTFKNELLTLRLRYKNPGEESSQLIEQVLQNNTNGFEESSDNFRFACGVTVYGLMLRDSRFKGDASYELATSLINGTKLNEKDGYKEELLVLIEKARELSIAH